MKLAPLDTPSKPGSAKGFCKVTWSAAEAEAIAQPTNKAVKYMGILIAKRMCISVLLLSSELSKKFGNKYKADKRRLATRYKATYKYQVLPLIGGNASPP